MPPMSTMNVLPNPECSLDTNGEPMGAVQAEGSSGRVWIGAIVDFERSAAEKRTVFIFDRTTPQPVPVTAYYLRRLQEGSLLPADKATADLAGVPFTEPKAAAKPKKLSEQPTS